MVLLEGALACDNTATRRMAPQVQLNKRKHLSTTGKRANVERRVTEDGLNEQGMLLAI